MPHEHPRRTEWLAGIAYKGSGGHSSVASAWEAKLFTHIFLGSNDVEAAKRFYDSILRTLGLGEGRLIGRRAIWRAGNGLVFGITAPLDGNPASVGNGATIGFVGRSQAEIDAWYAAGLARGGTDAGEPGKRPNAPGNTYAAYLRDLDGHKICASCQLED